MTLRTYDYGDFGKWLIGQIEENQWSQAEFARRIDVEPAKLSRWLFHPGPYVELRGRSAHKIAEGLGVPVEVILVHAGVIDPLENEEGRTIANVAMRIDWSQDPEMAAPIRGMLMMILDRQKARAAQEQIAQTKKGKVAPKPS